jgi:DNA-binding HxlR family transcriptional regulator
MDCSVAQCLEVTGEWWSMLIVRDALLGVTHFDAFQKRLGIARNILQHRLEGLIANGVMERSAYSTHPPRYDYLLTQKGRDLWPVINAMRQWGDRYAAPAGPPVVMIHKTCANQVMSVEVCSECAQPLSAENVVIVASSNRDASVVLPAT